ncbi:MAG: hypothetical protein JSS57_17490 [Proteobacteria bacterium]|nr:hypothetical protein [Pseudomonadota bacterium]
MKPWEMMRRFGQPTSGGGETDDFSTNTLSSYTEYADTAGDWSISGGYLSASSGWQAILTRNGVSFADGEVSAVITEANDTGLVLRLANNSNYYVAVIYDNSSSKVLQRSTVTIYKRVGGTYTQVGGPNVSIAPFNRGTPTTFTFSAIGTNLVVKVNGTIYINTTDSAISAPGLCGPRIEGAGGHKFDSFSWP